MNRIIKHLIISSLFLLFSFTVFSQKMGYMTFESKVVNLDAKSVENVTITLYEGTNVVETTTTPKSGKFFFNMFFGKNYTIVFSHVDYFPKKIAVNTNVPSSKMKKWYYVEGNTELFKKTGKLENNAFFNKPFVKIFYDDVVSDFSFDDVYKKQMEKEYASIVKDVKSKDNEEKAIKEQQEKEKLNKIKQEQQAAQLAQQAAKKAEEEKQKQLAEEKLKKLKSSEEQKTIEQANADKQKKAELLAREAEQKLEKTKHDEEILRVKTKENTVNYLARKIDEKEFQKRKVEIEEKTEQIKQEKATIVTKQEVILREEKKEIKAKAFVNNTVKNTFLTEMINTANKNDVDRKSEDAIYIKTSSIKLKTRSYPIIKENKEEDFFKKKTTTIVILPNQQVILYKYDYILGSSYYFMNAKPIEKDDYNHEMAKYFTLK